MTEAAAVELVANELARYLLAIAEGRPESVSTITGLAQRTLAIYTEQIQAGYLA
jgi:hypothetical protein